MKIKKPDIDHLPDDTLRVGFLSHSAGELGAELALLELIDGLTENGIKCHVLLPCDGPLVSRLRSRGIAFAIIPYKSWMYKETSLPRRIGRMLFNLLLLIPIMIRIKRWRCRVIYTNTIMIFVGGLAAKFLNLPHVWHIHEFGEEDHGYKFDFGERLCCWFMNRLSDAVICVSKSIAAKYRVYINSGKIRVIYQSVSLNGEGENEADNLLPQSKENLGLRCAIIGNIDLGKRQKDAVIAVKDIIQRGIKAKLYVVGGGNSEYSTMLTNYIQQHNLQESIYLLGYRKDFISIIKAVDIVLICSQCEGFGRITIYAMLCGKPVVGTNTGCTPELVQNGKNGLLYTPEDTKQLARHLVYLNNNPQIMRRFGEDGRIWAEEKFTIERYGDEVTKIVNDLSNGNFNR